MTQRRRQEQRRSFAGQIKFGPGGTPLNMSEVCNDLVGKPIVVERKTRVSVQVSVQRPQSLKHVEFGALRCGQES
ncbi:MAG: hypothetical protein IPI58_07830 [Alphaproteobacteria bacterium]|nr:MAG: hypothetical protein IPI58_07830 [Alphaproteobacteria bacterium]